MKSGIGRFASFAVLSLAVAVQALAADGPDMQGRPAAGSGQSQGRPQGNNGGQDHGRPQGNNGGQWQGRPQGGNGGQDHGRPQGNNGGQWQGRPQAGNEGQEHGRPQGNNGGQWQGRPQGNNGGQWQGRPPGNNSGHESGRPPGNNSGQWQGGNGGQDHGRPPGNNAGQWQGRPPGNNGGQWQGRPPSNDHGSAGWQGGNRPPSSGWQGRPPPSHGNWGPHPSYWRPGYVVNTMPSGHYRVPYRGSDYYFNDGYWYRPYGSRYVVVTPPYGVRVRYLPSYAEQVWIGSIGYFLAAGTYYLWQASSQDYEVVEPPQQQVASVAQSAYDVIAYPMYNQGPDQQARDRYECHRWAADQSGFDPALASYAPPAYVADNYRRALGACLSGRGYSVN
ncbi:MAG: glycine zipper family protein [Pseudomonas sp.]